MASWPHLKPLPCAAPAATNARSGVGRVLAEIAKAHHASPRQVVLAFLTRWDCVFAIPKASTPAHAEENAGAGALQLAKHEVERVDAAFPLEAPPRALPVL
jgi:diketogulonate reductase-like aldo/keto reductase